MSQPDQVVLVYCRPCQRHYAWDGNPCPGCGRPQWVPPPSALTIELQGIAARRMAGEIGPDQANAAMADAYRRHTAPDATDR